MTQTPASVLKCPYLAEKISDVNWREESGTGLAVPEGLVPVGCVVAADGRVPPEGIARTLKTALAIAAATRLPAWHTVERGNGKSACVVRIGAPGFDPRPEGGGRVGNQAFFCCDRTLFLCTIGTDGVWTTVVPAGRSTGCGFFAEPLSEPSSLPHDVSIELFSQSLVCWEPDGTLRRDVAF